MVHILSYLKLFGVLSILGACITGYFYIANLQSSLQEYQKLTTQLELKVSEYENQILKVNEVQSYLNNQLQQVRQQNRLLEKKLEDNNLKNITKAKPSLVEDIVNSATQKANRCFELLSGSPLTDKEKNAKNANEFNSECPWLYSELIPNK